MARVEDFTRPFQRFIPSFPPIPYSESRRSLLKAAAGTAGAIYVAGAAGVGFERAVAGAKSVAAAFKPVTRSPRAEREHDYELYPGCIEDKITQPFLQWNRGHFPWLREAINNNPILEEVTLEGFAYQEKQVKANTRIKFGREYAHLVNDAYSRLSRIPRQKVHPAFRDNLEFEANHFANIAHAAVYGTSWWDPEELKHRYHVDTSGYPDINSFYWNTSGRGTRYFAEYFGEEQPEKDRWLTDHNRPPIFRGPDRVVHLSHHKFIAFEDRYSRHFGLSEHLTLPPALRWAVNLEHEITGEERALILSRNVGLLYEARGTKKSIEDWYEDPSVPMTEGILDVRCPEDLKANKVGASGGNGIFDALLGGFSPERIIQEFDDPKFTRRETEPELESARLYVAQK